MDLSTRYMGLKLSHPFVPGASPLADNLDLVRRLEEAGAPAILMRSLFEEQITREQVDADPTRPCSIRPRIFTPGSQVRSPSRARAVGHALIANLVRSSGMRMVGPNCMGVINTDPTVSLNGTFAPTFPPCGAPQPRGRERHRENGASSQLGGRKNRGERQKNTPKSGASVANQWHLRCNQCEQR